MPCPGATGILEVTRAIDWGPQVRSYVHGQGYCAGLLASGKGEVMKPFVAHPASDVTKLVKLVNQHFRGWCPRGYGWTSLQINVGTQADWH